MNYIRLLRESNKQWEVLSKNNGLVPLWSGLGRDGSKLPTGSEGRWEKFKPAQRPKMTTHLWAGHVFPAFDFWHLSTAHVLVVFAHFFIFMKMSEIKWMRAYRQTTRWPRGFCRIQHANFQFWGQNGFRSYERQNINGHGRNANYQNHAWSYPNFATVLEQNLKLETFGLSDCIASLQES